MPTPEDVPRTYLKGILWTSPYGALGNAKGRPLPLSWGHPLPTSCGCCNMTSWGRPNVTSWGHSHNVLYVTPRDIPCRRLEDASCRRYDDVPYGLICNSKERVLPTSWGRPSETSLYGSISKTEKHPRDKDFCTWSYHQWMLYY